MVYNVTLTNGNDICDECHINTTKILTYRSVFCDFDRVF